MNTTRLTRSLLLASLLALAGCPGPATVPDDGGEHADADRPGDAHTLPDARDGGPIDDDAPSVVSSLPGEGDTGVAPSTDVEITFSEAMNESVGTATVRAEGVEVPVTTRLEGDALTLHAEAGWPAAAEVEVRLDTDFADLAGHPLARPFVVRFTVDDTGAPHVVSSTPAEGATGLPSRTRALRITFSEPMDQGAGTPTLEGGPGAIDAATPTWAADHVVYALSGLANDTAYRVVLSGYRDLSGNSLDGASYLVDGAIDFTTGADDEPPEVLDTTPNETQVDVSVDALDEIVVTFDEDMNTSIASAPLRAGPTTRTVPGHWDDARTVRFDVRGALALEATHTLDLRGMRDLAGVALRPAPVLGDGQLDFTTGADAFIPYVAASEPAEGATGVASPLAQVRLAFSEAMNEAETSALVTEVLSGTSTSVEGTWSNGGTVLTLPGSAFAPGRSYRIDARGLHDLAGAAVSDAHPYLGDGVLDFALARPTGESCAQPLELEHATSVTAGVYQFVIAAAQRTRYNGSASCDFDGVEGGDAVIHVHKTTPAPGDPSGNGRALRVRTYGATNRANVEILSGICDPRDPATTHLRCAHRHEDWDIVLPVGPGDYYVWISTADGSAFSITASIEEVATVPEGQSCEDPFDTTSSVYTAPATTDAPHVFDLPASTGASVDITDTNERFEAMSCVEELTDDVVVRFDKAADDTLLEVRVVPGGFFRRMEIVSGACRRSAPGASSELCSSLSNQPQRFTVRAPAGPVYVWIGGTLTGDPVGANRVEIRELPVPTTPGSSCANAIPITPGATIAVAPTVTDRVDGPSCVPEASGVTWYALTTTEPFTHVQTDLDGSYAIVDAASGTELSCATTAAAGPLAHLAPVGTRVCIALQSGSAISSLSVEEIPYTGVGIRPPATIPAPTRPSLEGTPWDESLLVNESWTVVTPSRIVQNFALAAVLELPRAGGTVLLRREFDLRVMGNDAVTAGESVWMVANNIAVSPRLFRLYDDTGAWAPLAWDRGTTTAVHQVPGTMSPATLFTRALAYDGADLYGFDAASSTQPTPVVRWPDDAPGAAVRVADITGVYEVAGAAMDATNVFLCGRAASGSSTRLRGVYRVSRADLDDGTATATQIAYVPVSTNVSCQIVVDDPTSAHYVYVRDGVGDVNVVADPGGTPRWLGIVFRGDRALTEAGMDLDRTTGTLIVFSTRDDVERGNWYELRP